MIPRLRWVIEIFVIDLTIKNFVKKQYFSTKFGDRFSNLLRIRCLKFYFDFYRFGIFIVHCLGVYFFLDTV